jgi:hypothetical protein
MQLRYHGGAFADRAAHPFDRAEADVADREHGEDVSLQRQWRMTIRLEVG